MKKYLINVCLICDSNLILNDKNELICSNCDINKKLKRNLLLHRISNICIYIFIIIIIIYIITCFL